MLEKQKLNRKHFTFREMSKHCQVQPTYLSNVLAEHERSVCKERQKELHTKIESLKATLKNTEKSLDAKTTMSKDLNIDAFHLDISAQIVHMFLTIENYRSYPEHLPRLLNISSSQLASIFSRLEAWGLITRNAGVIQVTQNELHLARSSRVFPAFHTMRLLKCIELINHNLRDDDFNFSVLFSSTKEVKAKLHAKFLEFLKEVQKEVGAGKEENVYLMNFDLVSLSY